jgi:hypothetical protein
MTDDWLDILKASGLINRDGELSNMGDLFQNALFAVVSHTEVNPVQLAEVLAQFITLTPPLASDVIDAPPPIATLHVNLNVNVNTISDYKLNQLAEMV